MSLELTGPWDHSRVEQYLEQTTLPVRLSCLASDGFPRVISLWYRYHGGEIFCITHQSARLVTLLKQNQRVGFEISPDAPPYHGVRGQGTASLSMLGNDSIMEDLLTRYTGGIDTGFAQWLLSRKHEEFLIAVKPHRLFSWDYRQRMAEVV